VYVIEPSNAVKRRNSQQRGTSRPQLTFWFGLVCLGTDHQSGGVNCLRNIKKNSQLIHQEGRNNARLPGHDASWTGYTIAQESMQQAAFVSFLHHPRPAKFPHGPPAEPSRASTAGRSVPPPACILHRALRSSRRPQGTVHLNSGRRRNRLTQRTHDN
jgi:hypothetical protein